MRRPGVVETVDPDAVMEHEEELLMELRAHKKETGVDLSFLAIVDVVCAYKMLA
jgi:hypothetical protein